jgi:hypothetical protein
MAYDLHFQDKEKLMSYHDRVRENSSETANRKIDEKALSYVRHYIDKSAEEIDARIEMLDKEWDIERVLELNAASLALSGVLLGLKDQRWTILSGVVGAFLIQHAIQGWCPPVVLFRALGVRTRKEIDQEKYTLKAMRGDFKDLQNVKAAWFSAE